jgi:hypothetical protein
LFIAANQGGTEVVRQLLCCPGIDATTPNKVNASGRLHCHVIHPWQIGQYILSLHINSRLHHSERLQYFGAVLAAGLQYFVAVLVAGLQYFVAVLVVGFQYFVAVLSIGTRGTSGNGTHGAMEEGVVTNINMHTAGVIVLCCLCCAV